MAGSIGDLEYNKFSEDGTVKITEQEPVEIRDLLERQIVLLEDINKHLEVQIRYLQEFFVGGILDDHVEHRDL